MEVSEYISREAAIARLKRIVEVNRLRTDRAWFTPDGVEYLINEIPAADVRLVVRGKWEPSEKYKGYVSCSICHDCYVEQEWVTKLKWNFCPNCGARMEES